MRRASAELEKRRASLGTAKGLRSDGTLDPYYAAILFRDSRGVRIYYKKTADILIIANLFISSLFIFSCPSPIHSWKNTIFAIQVSLNYFVGLRKHSNCVITIASTFEQCIQTSSVISNDSAFFY